MKPVKTEDTNFTYKLPGGTDANDLPCRVEDDMVISAWQAEEGDLEQLSAERPAVVLVMWTANPVACSIKVGDGGVWVQLKNTARVQSMEDSTWEYELILTGREVQILRDGALVQITVDAQPTPPVAVRLA